MKKPLIYILLAAMAPMAVSAQQGPQRTDGSTRAIPSPAYAVKSAKLSKLTDGTGGVLTVEGFGTTSVSGPGALIPFLPKMLASGVVDFTLMGTVAVNVPPNTDSSVDLSPFTAKFFFHDDAYTDASTFRIRSATNVLEIPNSEGEVTNDALRATMPSEIIGKQVTSQDSNTVISTELGDISIRGAFVVAPSTPMHDIPDKTPLLLIFVSEASIVEAVRWQ
ncbi:MULTISPECIES: hypothetical protein [Phaeobacter]|uniref:hypothetical protein n=1 Tax=Phaeobacter TaxID=302485 RepID=UPI000CA3484C|nr:MULTISPECIES: hypothetical protein [Phaeobacter]AUQ56288.1 hypothetical protein PhaeoP92_03670 [Phaeobacter inhibens]AUQ80304.1 hypothetical protein PhaeoP74_03671 [Phaeobacter inhibens]AUR17463.1 hypothetical protein PhaeoP70_03669 [Phaeobacter inhibens]AUR37711.1 hypothetical protein PhaeoP18_03493 [Phaeobacter piscinae]